MESDRSTTRTYTANTCELIVSGREIELGGDRQPEAIEPVDFCLHLDRAERGELDRLTLQGQPQQLNRLQHVVSTYIAELVAKFPIPVSIDSVPPTVEMPAQIDTQTEVHVDQPEPSSRSGILKNLPGLRGSLPTEARADDRSGVSKMFGLQPQPTALPPDLLGATNVNIEETSASPATAPETPDRTTPYLTGSGDRSLDHYLHLGDLATVTAGDVISLSALQLFDLAIVLDEYANANLSPADRQRSATLSRTLFQSNPATTPNNAPASTSRLPNIPRVPIEPAVTPIYYRNRRSGSSFMSGIPWAIAAALAVGVPFALLDPNPNLLKDAANKVKLTDLATPKKSGTDTRNQAGTTKTDPSQGSNSTAALPTPWQAQPVAPPTGSKSLTPGLPSTTSSPGKLGSVPLPEALGGKAGSDAPAPSTPGSSNNSATNSIGSTNPVPPNFNASTATTPGSKQPGTKIAPGTPAPKSAPTQIGQLPIDIPSTGKISISKQPSLLPTTERLPSAPVQSVPFPPSGLDESGRIDPFNRPTSKKADGTSKPAVATKPKPSKPKSSALNPSASEPFTPIPKNPNLIDPSNNAESTDPQVQPIVPDRPLQSNNSADPSENNPTLQETKRYFQGKWKASTTQPNALQYVLQVGKNGTVRSVSPQGEAATTYLQQTKLIKPGQKLLSPAAGSSDQKIRVLLQPDGGVDTFTEP